MGYQLEVGTVLYYKTKSGENITRCSIIQIDENYIMIKLEKAVNGKFKIKLQKKSIGEWLFFDKRDIALSLEELSQDDIYIDFCNKRILDTRNKTIEKEDESKKQTLEKKSTEKNILVKEKSDEKKENCDICMIKRRGDCFGSDKICDDYRPIPLISTREIEWWPKYGDAIAFKSYNY